jgi:hypothetical protein
MRPQTLRAFAERLSFCLWIAFTIFAISLAGIGIEGMIFAIFMLMASSAEPVHFPLAMVVVGGLAVLLSILWRQVGIDHLHYLAYDTVASFDDDEADAPSSVLRDLIREVELSAGLDRTDARAKAKSWLLDHVSSLDGEDIRLARTHFGYMLPAEWGD